MKLLIFTFVSICLSSTFLHCDGLRILGLFPFQVRSHYTMCEELMRGLAGKGHQVDVYSHFPLKKPIPNYKDFSLQGTLRAVTNNLSFEHAQLSDPGEVLEHWFTTHQEAICDLLKYPVFQELLHNPPKDPPYDLVITELSLVYCYIPFGRLLNVPVIGIVTLPLLDWHFEGFGTPINIATDPSVWSSYQMPMPFFERLGNLILHHRILRKFNEHAPAQGKYVEKYFGSGLPSVADLQKDVSLVLVNHDIHLNGVKPFSPKVIPVAGLHVVDHNDTLPQVVQKWLDESIHGCVYFSFGSMTRVETFPKHMIKAFYKAFENIAPVRILFKVAKAEELPPGLPKNVLTQPWLQQIQVLKHKNVKAFVTHGGLMGTQESVFFGVPMVGIPLFADQYLNINGYVNKNIAVKVELSEISEETFTNALIEILKNPKYRKSMEEASRKFKDRPLTVMDTAIYWVEYVHRYGKDALKSPIEDLTWWQASLLDVYSFIAVIILSVSYIIAKIVGKLYSYSMTQTKSNTKLKKN